MSALRIGLICGGPSLERGISLNSARSVLDHLSRDNIIIQPIYIDYFKNFYLISPAQLYSNTPSDFDFKLGNTAKKIERDKVFKDLDIVFPVIHGVFGEDGELQKLLEQAHIPFVGSGSVACRDMFNKNIASKIIKKNNWESIPSALLLKNQQNNSKIITDFFQQHKLTRAIIKPVAGGSSIGVFSINTPAEAEEKLAILFGMGNFNEAIIEPFCHGKEFTVVVIENFDNKPIALVPTEVQVSYEHGGIFDYRRKYLPTANTIWHCPPRFDDKVVIEIQQQAEKLFKLFNMRDFARLDGWVLDSGKIVFSDFNPISGMEQNSFIFQQASRLQMTHGEILDYILSHACHREKISFPKLKQKNKQKKLVKILFGGNTSERQVSLMSGTNVWLKLRHSEKYHPEPYLLDKQNYIWHLPYTFSLNHTVEEIEANCLMASAINNRLKKFIKIIRAKLGLVEISAQEIDIPKRISAEKFLEETRQEKAFLFLGLHGGDGENGVWQQKLAEYTILHNGSLAESSALCMDKYLTGKAVANIGDESIMTVPKKLLQLSHFYALTQEERNKFWQELLAILGNPPFIIKPRADGCSTGIILLKSLEDLEKYIYFVNNKAAFIPEHTFFNQASVIEMPAKPFDDYLLESFIETDQIVIKHQELIYQSKIGWLELTIGVLENKNKYYALNPSITVSEGVVLTVEEKFQGGTGINLTPPPETIISSDMLAHIKKQAEKISKALAIKNYARLDLFFNINSQDIYVIEANTLPALTPSTVLYQQALTEKPTLFPLAFLEKIIEFAGY